MVVALQDSNNLPQPVLKIEFILFCMRSTCYHPFPHSKMCSFTLADAQSSALRVHHTRLSAYLVELGIKNIQG